VVLLTRLRIIFCLFASLLFAFLSLSRPVRFPLTTRAPRTTLPPREPSFFFFSREEAIEKRPPSRSRCEKKKKKKKKKRVCASALSLKKILCRWKQISLSSSCVFLSLLRDNELFSLFFFLFFLQTLNKTLLRSLLLWTEASHRKKHIK